MSMPPNDNTAASTPTTSPPQPPPTDYQDPFIGFVLIAAGIAGLFFVIYLVVEHGESIYRSGRLVLNTALVSAIAMTVASLLIAGAGQGLIYLSRIAHTTAVTARILNKRLPDHSD